MRAKLLSHEQAWNFLTAMPTSKRHLLTQIKRKVLFLADLRSSHLGHDSVPFQGRPKSQILDFASNRRQVTRLCNSAQAKKALSHTAVTRSWPSPAVSSTTDCYGTVHWLCFQFLQIRGQFWYNQINPSPLLASFITAFKQCLVEISPICTCCFKPRVLPTCPCAVMKMWRTRDTSRSFSFCPVHRCWKLTRHYHCKNTLDQLTKEWLKSLKDQGGEWQSFLNLHFLLFSKKRNKIYIKDAIEIYKV